MSPLVYSASNTDVPREVVRNIQGRLFKFLRSGLYHDHFAWKRWIAHGWFWTYDQSTVLQLAWIPRLLKSGQYLPRFETAVSSSGTKEGLEDFTTFVNNFHPSLKFTWAISDDKLPFLDLLTYHPRNTQAREITTRNFALLKSDPDTKDIFQPVRILCAYRRDNNLRDILVKSSLQTTGPTNGESGTCGCRRCVTCAHTNPSRTLDTPGGQLRFEDRFTCTTSNLIYVSTPRAVNWDSRTDSPARPVTWFTSFRAESVLSSTSGKLGDASATDSASTYNQLARILTSCWQTLLVPRTVWAIC